jgi:hypothetical protein
LRRSALRRSQTPLTRGRLRRVSKKVRAGEAAFQAVYRQVDARSGGRCEVREFNIRCLRPARDHHHLYKPRRSHHSPELIVHLCRPHHNACERSYSRGRLVIALVGGQHMYQIVTAADKWAAR